MKDRLKIVLVGAGSREFGPASIRDLLLSDPLCDRGLSIVLVDIDPSELPRTQAYAESVADRLGRRVLVSATTDLERALPGAHAVVMAIELRRYFHWAQDFHVPRNFGSRQIYGENGGPGGLFHALRKMKPALEVARAMEAHCPEAWLVNYTNPLTKLCEAQSRLSSTRVVGLCHGVFDGMEQMARLLDLPADRLDARASGLNHFAWFESVRDRETGEDLGRPSVAGFLRVPIGRGSRADECGPHMNRTRHPFCVYTWQRSPNANTEQADCRAGSPQRMVRIPVPLVAGAEAQAH